MKNIILAGGGHGHINILKELKKKKRDDVKITLITDFPKQYYSGMLPGFLEDIYSEEEISFDVRKLCGYADVEYVNEKILSIDADNKTVKTDRGIYDFDFISLNLGAQSKHEFSFSGRGKSYVKPISEVVEFKRMIEAESGNSEGKKRLVIVGAGASGVEIALALSKYDFLDIHIVSSNKNVLSRFNKSSQKKLTAILSQKKIKVHTGMRVVSINENSIDLENTDKEYSRPSDELKTDYDYLLVSTGFSGCDVRFKGYDVAGENYLIVDDRLMANEFTIAMGDMIHLKNHPDTPKAGVFAIRQAPVLYRNLFKMIDGREDFTEYIPQKKYLQILNCGNKKALFNYGKSSFYGSIPWMIKNKIDRDYMKI